MTGLVVNTFAGVTPRRSPELLTLQGQVALNCRLMSGKLAPWNVPLNIAACPTGTEALYRLAVPGAPNGPQWLTWDNPVNACSSIIPGDQFGRLFFTGSGVPAATDYALAVFGNANLLTTDYTDHAGAYTWAPSTTTIASLSVSVGEVLNFCVQAFSDDTNTAYGQVTFYNSASAIIATVNGNAVSSASNYAYSFLSTIVPAGTVYISVATACTGTPTHIHSRIGYLTRGTQTTFPAAQLPLGVPAPSTALTATPASGIGSTGSGAINLLRESLFTIQSSTVVDGNQAGTTTVTASGLVTSDFGYTANVSGSYKCTMAKDNGTSDQTISGTITAILTVDGSQVFSQTDMYDGSASGGDYTFNYSYPGDSQLSGSHTYQLQVSTPNAGNLNVTAGTARFNVQLQNQAVIEVTNGSTLVAGDSITLAGGPTYLNGQQLITEVTPGPSGTTLVGLQLMATNAAAVTLAGTWAQYWTPANQEDTAYITTFLIDFDGQMLESAPSPASKLVARGQTQPVILTNIPALPTLPAGTAVTAMNLYRTVAGSIGDAYQFVHQYNATSTPTLTAFLSGGDTDSATDASLGEVLPTLGWIAPPTDLQGLVCMPNGFLAGFVANSVWLCVPYQPQAWPVGYSLSVDSNIVGLCPIGQSLAILTEGKPYLLTGVDPSQMAMQRIELAQACVSARSIVDMGYSALYASTDGIAMLASNGPQLVSNALWTKDEFALLNPSSFVAGRWHNSYVCFYNTGTTQGGFIFDPQEPEATLTFTTIYATACWTDPDTGELYLVVGNEIVQWDAGATPMTYTWQSRDEVSEAPVNMAVGRVRASSYPVTFTLFADGVQQDVITVANDEMFRLAGGYRYRRFSFQLNGTGEVLSAAIGQSAYELKQSALQGKEFDKNIKRMLSDYRLYP